VLAGDWTGTFEWTGGRKDSGKMNATYYLTGNGSAVVENLTIGGLPSMTSVYHLDGSDLRMTHYCRRESTTTESGANRSRARQDPACNARGIRQLIRS
jgi:hypothetical protein